MKYKLELAAVQEWLTGTRWSQKQMTKETLDKIQSALFEMQLITTTLPLEDFLSK